VKLLYKDEYFCTMRYLYFWLLLD